MTLVVLGSEDVKEVLKKRQGVEWVFCSSFSEFSATPGEAYFCLVDEAAGYDYTAFQQTVFVHSILHTLNELKGPNVIRLNAWPGFLSRDSWEMAGNINEKALSVLSTLGIQPVITSDVPGFISARILALIINEAFYMEEEKISTRDEVDIAMKLGTNYPLGPFEWFAKIGLDNIYALLEILTLEDRRYTPSLRLTQLKTHGHSPAY